MAGRLDGRSVVVLLAEGFEDLEFWVTVMRLQEEGAHVTVAGLTTQPVHGKNGPGTGWHSVELGLGVLPGGGPHSSHPGLVASAQGLDPVAQLF